MQQLTKRRAADEHGSSNDQRSTPSSLTRSISPPSRSKKARISEPSSDGEETNWKAEKPDNDDDETSSEADNEPIPRPENSISGQIVESPFELTKIRDLPPESNIDCLTLKDILGDPLISECWEFNYLHDVDFLMSAFDPDVQHLVKVHVVHGFWKKEDANRLALVEAASRYPNVTLYPAYMPEMFGTHHSKMMILVRHDDAVQIVIHTANMIVRDWTNMTQAVWRSPLLPRLTPQQAAVDSRSSETLQPGSGEKFKVDFLAYLQSYNVRRPTCTAIASQLRQYDFSSIKGSLIASVPGRHDIHDQDHPRWGWVAMKQTLKSVPVHHKSTIAVQISSIATLGPTDTWLKNTLFNAFSAGQGQTVMTQPEFKVIFPTPDEIRTSLDGYGSGGSIHTKIQSAQQRKQLQYLKPIFHHWGNDSPDHEAGRSRAAPHIKTYIRYGNKSHESIDWALLTSANLSKQAWGEAASTASGEMRIASYEIGVLVWPGLWDTGRGAVMKGVFMGHTPSPGEGGSVVGLRMPYSLPLRKYEKDELPWVATASYEELDWMGRSW